MPWSRDLLVTAHINKASLSDVPVLAGPISEKSGRGATHTHHHHYLKRTMPTYTGTGKTFIGLKVMEALLTNKRAAGWKGKS